MTGEEQGASELKHANKKITCIKVRKYSVCSLLEINNSVEMKCLLCNLVGKIVGRILATWILVHVLLGDLRKVTFFKFMQDRNSHFLFKLKYKNELLWLLFWFSAVIFLSQFSCYITVAVL